MLFFSFQKTSKVTTPPQQSAPNQKVSFDELVEIIQGTPHDSLSYIRSTTKNMVSQGASWKAIKGAIDYHKKQLPYFLFSGHCEKHHNNKTLEYNGCIQVDIDFKFAGGNLRALQVKEDAKSLPYVKLACISPSGYGVKILVQTSNTDKNTHKIAQGQVISAISSALQIDKKYFDSLGASQPCYVPFDKQAYFEDEVDVFQVVESRADTISSTQSFDYAGSDWIGFCTAYAFADDRKYVIKQGDHTNHLFLTYFAICANLLGIPQNDVWAYAATQNVSLKTNAISRTYREYKDHHGAWRYKLEQNRQAEKTQTIEGKEGQKLTNLIKPDDIIGKNLIAPTGSGKTYIVAHTPGRKILVVPTIALSENIEKEYNACRIGGNRRAKKHYTLAQSSDFIVVTYASFKSLSDELESKETINVFIDEAHNFSASTSRSFQLSELRDVLEYSQAYNSVTTLTGTEVYQANEFLRSLPKLEVKIPRPLKTAQIIGAVDTLYTTARAAKKSIEAGRFPIILLDNKGDKLAKIQGYLRGLNIKYFNSDTKQDQDWSKVTSAGIINEGIQGIVTTSVLKEGNNLYNAYGYDVIVYGTYHSSAIEQISNRPRRAKSVHIQIIRSNEREQNKGGFEPERYASFIKAAAQRNCDEWNAKGGCTEEQLQRERRARMAIQAEPVRVVDGLYRIDTLLLSHFVFNAQKTQENRNDELLQANLGAYGIAFLPYKVEHIEAARADQKAAELSVKERKEKDLQEYTDAVKELGDASDPEGLAEYRAQNDKQLTKSQKRAYDWYLKMLELGCNVHKNIIEELKMCEGKQSKFRRLVLQITAWQLETDPNYMAQNRKLAILAKAIRQEFEAGQTLTGKAIQAKIISVLQIDSTIRIEDFEGERATRAINTLRIFFSVESIRVREDGKRYRIFEVRDLSFDWLFKNSQQTNVPKAEIEAEYWLEPAPF